MWYTPLLTSWWILQLGAFWDSQSVTWDSIAFTWDSIDNGADWYTQDATAFATNNSTAWQTPNNTSWQS